MGSSRTDRLKGLAALAGRTLGAFLIVYLFVVILMAASAQSNIAGRLKPPLDYSGGYAAWQRSIVLNRRIEALGKLLKAQQGLLETSEIDVKIGGSDFLMEEAPIIALKDRLAPYKDCQIPYDQNTNVASMLSALSDCEVLGNIPTPLLNQVKAALSDRANLYLAQKRYLTLAMQNARLENEVASIKAAYLERSAELKGLETVSATFSELSVMEQNSWLGGAAIVSFPPSMLQILLAFAAGLFGALLVTLVLVVYPNNNFDIASSRGGYEARVLLGGIISLCVFVVMGGGTAVLGTGSAFASGNVNFLAFCAIGILAGMFSDRVAAWLSNRANSLFKEKDDIVEKAKDASSASGEAKAAADKAAAASAEAANAAAARVREVTREAS